MSSSSGSSPRRAPEPGSLAEAGEFGLIAQITEDLPLGDAVVLGPGDDAAVVSLTGDLVVSTDTMVEGVHFRRDWSLAPEVGSKAVAAAVADIEAMGATPVAMVVSLAAPDDLPASWLRQCGQGMRLEAARSGTSLVGGDLTRAPQVVITVTVHGDAAGRRLVTRAGARPGQVVALCGRVGWAAAGLRVLGKGFRSPRAVVEAQKVPQVPYGEGRRAAEAGATAMVDVSDGLLADLGHVAVASGVEIDLDSSAFGVPDPIAAVAAATGADPLALMLGGGEDHALAATFDHDAVPEGWTVIGTVTRRSDEPEVLVDRATWEGDRGHDHFRR
ncbi:thiamine-phosphate kinase [Mariniluteicoccus flavus]